MQSEPPINQSSIYKETIGSTKQIQTVCITQKLQHSERGTSKTCLVQQRDMMFCIPVGDQDKHIPSRVVWGIGIRRWVHRNERFLVHRNERFLLFDIAFSLNTITGKQGYPTQKRSLSLLLLLLFSSLLFFIGVISLTRTRGKREVSKSLVLHCCLSFDCSAQVRFHTFLSWTQFQLIYVH